MKWLAIMLLLASATDACERVSIHESDPCGTEYETDTIIVVDTTIVSDTIDVKEYINLVETLTDSNLYEAIGSLVGEIEFGIKDGYNASKRKHMRK